MTSGHFYLLFNPLLTYFITIHLICWYTFTCYIQASDSTTLGWSPDGAHVLTATTSPRLREGNGWVSSLEGYNYEIVVYRFKLWHFTGALIYEEATPSRHELWEVSCLTLTNLGDIQFIWTYFWASWKLLTFYCLAWITFRTVL